MLGVAGVEVVIAELVPAEPVVEEPVVVELVEAAARTGRGIASSSTAVDAARAASSSASAASESCSSSDARAERTRRVFGAGASASPLDADAAPEGTSVAARMASIRSAFRMRVAAFTPIALGDGVELLAVLAREHGPLDLLLRTHLLSLSPPARSTREHAADAYGNLLSAHVGERSPAQERHLEWAAFGDRVVQGN